MLYVHIGNVNLTIKNIKIFKVILLTAESIRFSFTVKLIKILGRFIAILGQGITNTKKIIHRPFKKAKIKIWGGGGLEWNPPPPQVPQEAFRIVFYQSLTFCLGMFSRVAPIGQEEHSGQFFSFSFK